MQVLTPMERDNFIFPVTDGTVKISGGDQRLRTSTLIRDRQTEEKNKKFFKENQTDSLLQPHFKMTKLGTIRTPKIIYGLSRRLHLSLLRETQSQNVHDERRIISHSAGIYRRYQKYSYITGRNVLGKTIRTSAMRVTHTPRWPKRRRKLRVMFVQNCLPEFRNNDTDVLRSLTPSPVNPAAIPTFAFLSVGISLTLSRVIPVSLHSDTNACPLERIRIVDVINRRRIVVIGTWMEIVNCQIRGLDSRGSRCWKINHQMGIRGPGRDWRENKRPPRLTDYGQKCENISLMHQNVKRSKSGLLRDHSSTMPGDYVGFHWFWRWGIQACYGKYLRKLWTRSKKPCVFGLHSKTMSDEQGCCG